MFRGRAVCAVITLVLLGAASGILQADTIRLKNGRRMTGTVVKQTAEQVVFDVGAGRVTFANAEIASIEFDASAPVPASSSTPKAPQPRPLEQPSRQPAADRPLSQSAPRSASSELRGGPAPDELLELADEILPVVASLRGLQPKAQIAKRVVDKATIRKTIQQEMARQYSAQALANKGKALIKLGLLPSYVNLAESIIQLYTHQIAGMYDPYTKTLYLADWIPAALQAGTMAHELTHALQDQHFDLLRYLDEAKGDSEAETARQAIMEGEALAVMLDYQLKDQGLSFTSFGDLASLTDAMLSALKQSNPGLSTMPTYLEESMLFPYVYGMTFLQTIRKRHPWSRVDQLYRDPPRSTEQIMHPEKYLTNRDDPTPIQLADLGRLLGPSWRRIDEDVVGEFAIRSLVRQYVDGETAAVASEGWDGDRYHLYEHAQTNHLLLVWLSVWDSIPDAQEFLDAYRKVVAEKYLEEQPVLGHRDHWQTEANDVNLEHRHAVVLVIEGAPRSHLDGLVSQLWQGMLERGR